MLKIYKAIYQTNYTMNRHYLHWFKKKLKSENKVLECFEEYVLAENEDQAQAKYIEDMDIEKSNEVIRDVLASKIHWLCGYLTDYIDCYFSDFSHKIIIEEMNGVSLDELKSKLPVKDFFVYCKQELYPVSVVINDK